MKRNTKAMNAKWARTRAIRWGTAAVTVALTLATASACTSSSSSSSPKTSTSPTAASSAAALSGFPRSETLYTSGTAYAPPTIWNPFDLGNFATGTQGLIYEPLFLYDPVKNTYDPWLATSGTWSGNTYTITVRNGV